MVVNNRAAGCSILFTIAAISATAPIASANKSTCCFQNAPSTAHQLSLPLRTSQIFPAPSKLSEINVSLLRRQDGFSDIRRRRLLVVTSANDDKKNCDEKEDKGGKKGWFGLGGGDKKDDDDTNKQAEVGDDKKRKRNFFRRDQDKKKDNTKKKEAEKSDEGSSQSGGIVRRMLRSKSGDDDKSTKDKEDKSNKKLSLPTVDINAFVGPRMPELGSELDVRAKLNLSPEEIARKEKARVALKLSQQKRLEAQKRQEAKLKAAQERAQKLAEERRAAEQKKKEILERQRAVREAAKTKPGATATDKSEKDSADDDKKEGKGGRWPNFSLGGGGKKKDKAEEEKSKAEKKNERGVFGGLSGIFGGGGGGEKEQEGEWIVVCPKTRIMPGVVVPIVAAGLDLLIVASKDGKRLACIANSCPHLGTPLESGIIERRPAQGAAARKPDLADDGCEDCIVCPTHNTAFALESGEIRGEWCPYPPVIGTMMGAVKTQANLPTFQIRARGKNIEVRLASSLDDIKDR